MEKSNKSLLIITIFILTYINIFCITRELLFLTLKRTIYFSSMINVSLIIVLEIFIFYNKHFPGKVHVNYIFLLCSLLFFSAIIVYFILYTNTKIFELDLYILTLLVLISGNSLILAFCKNFQTHVNVFMYPFVIFIILLIHFMIFGFATLLVSLDVTISNPNRYEFVKKHYFSSKELANFPEKIPKDASNIKLHYDTYRGSRYFSLSFNLKNESGQVLRYTYSFDENNK